MWLIDTMGEGKRGRAQRPVARLAAGSLSRHHFVSTPVFRLFFLPLCPLSYFSLSPSASWHLSPLLSLSTRSSQPPNPLVSLSLLARARLLFFFCCCRVIFHHHD